MKISLLNGNRTIIASTQQISIMKIISNEIINIISHMYSKEEIDFIKFHLKGEPATNSLLIRLIININEPSDILSVMKDKLSSIDNNEDGLSFMNIYGAGFEYTDKTEISFWYKFNTKEYESWNDNSPYEFHL